MIEEIVVISTVEIGGRKILSVDARILYEYLLEIDRNDLT
jgi:hypothetical protein